MGIISTTPSQCRDCYKCVRNCPVKAIKVESGYASVIPELCVLCGQCVEVCPSHAKKVRDDLPRARQLLATRPKVMVSLARRNLFHDRLLKKFSENKLLQRLRQFHDTYLAYQDERAELGVFFGLSLVEQLMPILITWLIALGLGVRVQVVDSERLPKEGLIYKTVFRTLFVS